MKNIKIKKKDGISTVTLHENLGQNEYLELRNHLSEKLFLNGDIHVIINCEKVYELPSLAFGVFCAITRDTHRAGGKLGLIHVSQDIANVMAKTHIDQQVKIYGNFLEAKRDFNIDES